MECNLRDYFVDHSTLNIMAKLIRGLCVNRSAQENY